VYEVLAWSDKGLKEHWERLYRERDPGEFSWWQETPKSSLDIIDSLNIATSARIIDVGGGDGKLVDCLLDGGFDNITVLDISERAIDRGKLRLSDRAHLVAWVVSDSNDFRAESGFDAWHDRATFHFLTSQALIDRYISVAQQSVKPGGYLILGTFSSSGPRSCSGLPVQRYTDTSSSSVLDKWFEKIECFTEDHVTPMNTMQNFLYCSFRRRESL
jgi:2-polyprenyl-3-methyl-5-hydroxy-6-metoxy-1,4-benzoquinol methylase